MLQGGFDTRPCLVGLQADLPGMIPLPDAALTVLECSKQLTHRDQLKCINLHEIFLLLFRDLEKAGVSRLVLVKTDAFELVSVRLGFRSWPASFVKIAQACLHPCKGRSNGDQTTIFSKCA